MVAHVFQTSCCLHSTSGRDTPFVLHPERFRLLKKIPFYKEPFGYGSAMRFFPRLPSLHSISKCTGFVQSSLGAGACVRVRKVRHPALRSHRLPPGSSISPVVLLGSACSAECTPAEFGADSFDMFSISR